MNRVDYGSVELWTGEEENRTDDIIVQQYA